MTTETKYTSAHIANFFLWRAKKEGINITVMKLLKLVYIAYGWYLALKNDKLFDEEIRAWRYGPVVPSLYHEFKITGSDPIKGYAVGRFFNYEEDTLSKIPMIEREDKDTISILNIVWREYKNKDGIELSRITHAAGSPWSLAYGDGEGENKIIKDEDIKLRAEKKIREIIAQSKK